MLNTPNILLFNPDQYRGEAMTHMGNNAVRTPVLDRLVEDGAASFSRAFCQNPVCSPSRCSFMTGWYPHVHGHRTMHHLLHPERLETNMLQVLKENGYFVWWGGKNDLVPGQDGYEAHCSTHFMPTDEDYARWGYTLQPGLHFSNDWRGKPTSDNYYSFYAGKLDAGSKDIYFDHDWASVFGAIDFIRNYDGDQPLCIYLPLQYPHPPYGVEDPFYTNVDRASLPERIQAPKDWIKSKKPSILKGIHERQGLSGWSEDRFDELRATYYGMCSRVDYQFGLVLDALREKGFYDDTAIFFFSDHGDFTGDYGLVEKTQNTFEDVLTRVPFVVKLPTTLEGEVSDGGGSPVNGIQDTLIELLDLPATIYELVGIEPHYWHFGKSLLPVLTGKAETHRDEVFCEGGRLRSETQAMEKETFAFTVKPEDNLYYPRVGLQTSDDEDWHTKASMVRTARYKYVRRLYETDELYDLQTDPNERYNLIDNPELTTVLVDMRLRLLTWYQETADVVPLQSDKRFSPEEFQALLALYQASTQQ